MVWWKVIIPEDHYNLTKMAMNSLKASNLTANLSLLLQQHRIKWKVVNAFRVSEALTTKDVKPPA